jgi:hypothetical protein
MNPRTQRGIWHPALSLTTIASKLAPTKCVHMNVTIGAIYVCTFRFCAPKSYIPPTDVRRHALLNPLRKINTCSIGQFKLTIFQQLGEKP